ncbi:MAG: YfiR family protein [Verrucomicrobiota bacterium]
MLAWIAFAIPALGQVSKEELLPAVTFNLAKYVTWPDTPRAAGDEPFLFIGVYDSNDWLDAFRGLEDRLILEKKVRVIQLADGMDPDDMRRCQVIFTTRADVLQKLKPVAQRGEILLVADVKSAAANEHASVEFVPKGSRIGFEVSLIFVKASNLKISSSVLRLAEKVYKTED